MKKKAIKFFNELKKISNKNYTLTIKNSFLEISKKINFQPKVWLQNAQDLLEEKVVTRQEEVVLNPTRFWTRSITWALMGGTTFGILWLALAKTEEIIIVTGKLEPISGVIEVQMPLEGVIEEVLIKEGERVEKGQVLIKLDTEISEAKRLAKEKSLRINESILQKLSKLVEEGAVSELQYLQQENKVYEIKSDVTQNDVILKYQEILSPVSGTVFDLKPKGAGFVARTSEPVLKIVPSDNLQAKVEIPSRSIGFVSVGKKADISIDSFQASDFGVIEGSITSISSDALQPEPNQGVGYRFPAEIKLDTQYLKLKTGKKLNLPLQAGMSLTANIKLRKVSYLQLLLNNFSDKADSLKQL
tara:strand:+ start:2222 stop:3298 length:1077 start_codon:yes stop_codon:yes gene_type:complete